MVGRCALWLIAGVAGCASEPPPPPCIEPVGIDPAGVHGTWIVDSVRMPTNANEAQALGLELDCDRPGYTDNAFGQILSGLFTYWTDDVNGDVAGMIAEGRLLHLIDVQSTSLVDASGVGFTVLHGIDVDGDPADNFSGTETFAVDASRGQGTAAGSIVDHHVSARGGQMPIAFGLPSLEGVLVLPVEGVRVGAEVGKGSLSGRIGGGIRTEPLHAILIPVFEYALGNLVARDCTATMDHPPCGCADGAFGQTLLDLFDEQPDRPGIEPDGDCVITADELRDNSLVGSLLSPDIDLFDDHGDLNPGVDGIYDSLSIGIGFTAVPAGIQP